DRRLAAFQTESAARLEALTARLQAEIAALPGGMDERVASTLAGAAESLREEWRHDLTAAEQRIRAAMAADLASHREGAATMIRGLAARLDEGLANVPERAMDGLRPQLDGLAAAPAAVEARLGERLGEIALHQRDAVEALTGADRDLGARIDGLDADLGRLRETDRTIAGRVDAAETGLAGLGGRMAAAEDGIASLGRRAEDGERALAEAAARDEALAGRIDEVAAGGDALAGRIDADAARIEAAAAEAARLAETLAGRLDEVAAGGDALAGRIDAVQAAVEDRAGAVAADLGTRIAAGEERLAATEVRLGSGEARLTESERRIEELDRAMAELQAEAEDHGVRIAQQETLTAELQGRIDERDEDAADTPEPEAIERLREELNARIEQAVGALAPARHEATGVVAKAVSTLPSHEDLKKLGDQLRADLDWRLERLSAEQGWVTVNDVQALLRTQGGPVAAAAQPGTGAFPRLEAALTEFVRQLAEQQERFLAAVGANAGTARVALPEPALPASDPGTGDAVPEELMAALAALPGGDAPGDPPTVPMSLTEMLGAPQGGDDGAEAVAAALSTPAAAHHHDVPTSSIHDEETRVGLDSTPAEDSAARVVDRAPVGQEPEPAGTGLIDAGAADDVSASDLLTVKTAAVAAPGLDADAVRALVRETVAGMPAAPVAGEDLKRALAEWLRSEPARTAILAVVATEAVMNPGALAELTGLRAFLRAEVERALTAAKAEA
ncbi:MAG: hypothetical protein RLZZ127_2877, partial [Planctomycetota bacterium]